EEQARELSRRVRDDLVCYGLVRSGPEARLREGAVASPGDFIVARQNRRQITAGGAGEWLTNRDVLRGGAIGGGGGGCGRVRGGGRRVGWGDGRGGVRIWANRPGRGRSGCQGPIFSHTAIWRTRRPHMPSRAGLSTPLMCWSTGSATGKACTWRCRAG